MEPNMSQWTVVEKHETSDSIALKFITAGISGDMGLTDYCYTIEDESGRRKLVIASDPHELGEAIAEGSFYEAPGSHDEASENSNTSALAESSGEGGGGGCSGIIFGVLGFIIFMAIVSSIWPTIGHIAEAVFGFAIMAAIAFGLYRIARWIGSLGSH
jgi:hypothetical protein